MTTLKDKAISIKGKKYVLVSDRIIEFNKAYKNGSIRTMLVSEPESQTIIVKATIYPNVEDSGRFFTGYSQAVIGQGMVNKTAALENAETSAVGRALGMMGIGIIDSIASADEMVKAGVRNAEPEVEPIDEAIEDDLSEFKCSECGETISNKVRQYSERYFNKNLCVNCQRSEKK